MRGDEQRQAGFVVMTTLEDVVPDDHPLRAIRAMVDAALEQMSPELEALYAAGGRPSIAPEYLLRAQLVQILYAIGSERRLVEQLRYNLLLRWFVGLPLDEPVFHATRFTKNRSRLLTNEVAEAFFAAIRGQAEAHKLLSREHFSLDGTLIEAAAALKSLRPLAEDEGEEPPTAPRGRNRDVDWRGERRGNESVNSPPPAGGSSVSRPTAARSSAARPSPASFSASARSTRASAPAGRSRTASSSACSAPSSRSAGSRPSLATSCPGTWACAVSSSATFCTTTSTARTTGA